MDRVVYTEIETDTSGTKSDTIRNTLPLCIHCTLLTGTVLSGGGGRGAAPPFEFDKPKRSQIWYVARGATVAGVAKCESAAIDFWIFFKSFFMFCEISEPLSHLRASFTSPCP